MFESEGFFLSTQTERKVGRPIMTQAHLHLLVNHLPILGTAFGLLVLLFGAATRSQTARTAAYLLLAVSAAGGLAAHWSGEGAEEIVEDMAGFSHEAIEEHEQAAGYALGVSVVLGLLSLAGMGTSVFMPRWNGRMALVIGLVALFTFAVMARTGYLGGRIRHTELEKAR